jgi:hypothetical protein
LGIWRERVSDNDWETITKGGDAAIERWIAAQMAAKTCAIILIGPETAGRKWISFEISKAWNDGKGVFGIYVHNLKDINGRQTFKGGNPFDHVTFTDTGKQLSSVVAVYDPPYAESTQAYSYIKNNIAAWVETAITARKGSRPG